LHQGFELFVDCHKTKPAERVLSRPAGWFRVKGKNPRKITQAGLC
jgi:hypothetical protein